MKLAASAFFLLFSTPVVLAQSWIEDTRGASVERSMNSAIQLASAPMSSGMAEFVIDASYLARNAYGKQQYQKTITDKGWEQRDIILPTTNSGFSAAVYRKGDTYVIAFRGSENPLTNINDWFNDLKQNNGGPSRSAQYAEAIKAYNLIVNQIGNVDKSKIVITGHSLGGGLAQFIADKNGVRAITFNAAGLVSDQYQTFKRGVNPNIANINDPMDPVSQNMTLNIVGKPVIQIKGEQIGQEYLLGVKSSNGYLANHYMDVVIDKIKPTISAIIGSNQILSNRTTQTAATTTAQVSSIGPISFAPAQPTPPKTQPKPQILTSGTNTYSEGGWTVTYGLQSGLRQGVSGSQIGLSSSNDGFTVISNEGAPFIYAQRTFTAGAGNNGTFNFDALAAFITTEQQRCAPCSTFGLDKGYITFVSSTGQQVTKSLQEIYGVDRYGRVIFPNNPGNGTLTTPLRQVVQTMQMAPGSTMKVIVNVNNSVNNDTRYPSGFAVTNVRAR